QDLGPGKSSGGQSSPGGKRAPTQSPGPALPPASPSPPPASPSTRPASPSAPPASPSAPPKSPAGATSPPAVPPGPATDPAGASAPPKSPAAPKPPAAPAPAPTPPVHPAESFAAPPLSVAGPKSPPAPVSGPAPSTPPASSPSAPPKAPASAKSPPARTPEPAAEPAGPSAPPGENDSSSGKKRREAPEGSPSQLAKRPRVDVEAWQAGVEEASSKKRKRENGDEGETATRRTARKLKAVDYREGARKNAPGASTSAVPAAAGVQAEAEEEDDDEEDDDEFEEEEQNPDYTNETVVPGNTDYPSIAELEKLVADTAKLTGARAKMHRVQGYGDLDLPVAFWDKNFIDAIWRGIGRGQLQPGDRALIANVKKRWPSSIPLPREIKDLFVHCIPTKSQRTQSARIGGPAKELPRPPE
ncbi:hypothetical protein AURDEDRAFT_132173, partial [Auricularia subglabra TFB-10046 SS5]